MVCVAWFVCKYFQLDVGYIPYERVVKSMEIENGSSLEPEEPIDTFSLTDLGNVIGRKITEKVKLKPIEKEFHK